MKFVFLFLFLSLPAQAQWEIKSEFELHLSESLFDKLIADFWSSLNGQQNVPIGNFTITPEGIPVHINGVSAQIHYAFPVPERLPNSRAWKIQSKQLGGRLHVDNVSATQTIVREVNGIITSIEVKAECHNINLKLPEGSASVEAMIHADIVNNQVKLGMDNFKADWRAGAWELESISCSGDVQGLKELVSRETLRALESFQNFDEKVHNSILAQFEHWSKDASVLLLSEAELPTGKDYLKIFYEPNAAVDTGNGLLLRGNMRFHYPFVAPGQFISQSFGLQSTSKKRAPTNPMLLLPFPTLRALIMGEYFSGKLEYTLKAKEIPAFTELMNSTLGKWFAWPDLFSFDNDTQFAFQFLPMGPPSFENEKANGTSAIKGDLNLPLAVRMWAPINGVYTPYVEFRTMLSGSANLTLVNAGQVSIQMKTEELPLDYAWSRRYVENYNPNQHIAVDKMASAIQDSLNTNGFVIGLPSLRVGKSLKLKPQKWQLQDKNLRLDFTTAR